MATIDIVEDEDDELHLLPLEDHGGNREDIIIAEQRVFDGRVPSAKSGGDDVLVEDNEKIFCGFPVAYFVTRLAETSRFTVIFQLSYYQ